MPDNSASESACRNRSLIIATAGHVDHGKTALVNRLTGTDTDTLREEKARGLTINLGYAYHHFSSSVDGIDCNCTLGFVDVPGHIDFINNMLAGVGAVEFALLVIAADDGVMPQTREHLAILDLLGITRGAIALTKIDRCESSRLDAVTGEIADLVKSTVMADAPLFPVSSHSGAGIESLMDYLHRLVIEKTIDQDLQSNHGFRFLIDRCFSVKGAGTVVTGSVRSGRIGLGDKVLHTGTVQESRIRGMRLDTEDIDHLLWGQRGAVNIAMEQHKVHRGDWLIDPAIHHPVTRFDATIRFIEPGFELRGSAQYHLHIGASHHIVTIRSLGTRGVVFYQIKSQDLMIAHSGDRFIVRDPASERTIGGGTVVDIFVPRRRRGSELRLATLAAMNRKADASLPALLALLNEGVDLDQYLINRNLTATRLAALPAELKTRNTGFTELKLGKRTHPTLLHEAFFGQYRNQIVDGLAACHRSHGHQQGLSEPALSRTLDFEGSHLLFHALLMKLVNQGLISQTGTLFHLPGHEAVLSREQQEFIAKIRPLLIEAGNVPPRTRELVELTGIPLQALQRILREVTKSGSLIQVAPNRHYLPETIMALAEFTGQLANASADTSGEDHGFSVIQFRDASGIGRNLCIEILEYFDRIGFTRRDGNSRFLRTGKENLFGA